MKQKFKSIVFSLLSLNSISIQCECMYTGLQSKIQMFYIMLVKVQQFPKKNSYKLIIPTR